MTDEYIAVSTKTKLLELIQQDLDQLQVFNKNTFEGVIGFEKFHCTVSEVLMLSHMFCKCKNNLHTLSRLNEWIKNNQEYFYTDILYFHSLFNHFNFIVDIEPYKDRQSDSDDIEDEDIILKTIYTIISDC